MIHAIDSIVEMPKKRSAGLLLYRTISGNLEVLLVHPGGPFWANRDEGAWSIPKGEFQAAEDPLAAAKREFTEETGSAPSAADLVALEPVRQPSGKIIHAWAVRGEFDVTALKSNTFSLEWPPKSGHSREFPEVDRAAWFPVETAARKILQGQVPFLAQLRAHLKADSSNGVDSE